MYPQTRQLQQLKRRFVEWLPWLRQATQAEVTIVSVDANGGFKLVAKWRDAGEHEKIYDVAAVLRQGRVSCTKDYARAFVREVLGKRGVL